MAKAKGPAKSPVGEKLKTLDRVISRAGIGSRTEARKWIGAGRVAVNGKVIQTPDHWVNAERDRVTLDGKLLRSAKKRYIVLYKPKGYLTTARDPEGRSTVYDLLPPEDWLVPVGRLDQDTSGLLLMTNDTEFADYITDPVSHVSKTYLVKASTPLSDEQIEALRQGVELTDGVTRPAIVHRIAESGAGKSTIEISITEGRNRQIRRMLEAVGSRVRKLVRTSIGPLRLGTMKIGTWRELDRAEVAQLQPKRK
ncbi:MAG TPA: pseudouridine synthase [Bryobacteraceae bacterium]|nr:pseudouridine synthase [Bryobacteraceae bacterium]